MGQLTTQARDELLEYILTGKTLPFLEGGTYVHLVTAIGTPDTAGIEVAGNSYEPVPVGWTVSGGSAKNSDEVMFDILDDENSITVVGVEIWVGDPYSEEVKEYFRVGYAELSAPFVVMAGESFDIPPHKLELRLS